MVLVLIAQNNHQFPEGIWSKHFSLMPGFVQEQIMRLIRWQDRQASLLGKLLLQEGLSRFGYNRSDISLIKYSEKQRPYIDETFDFNISHSGNYVVCGITSGQRIGIDIEKIHTVNLEQFESFFSPDQWRIFLESGGDLTAFFRLWSKLESIIKWEGSGLFISVKKIKLHPEFAAIDDRKCYSHEVIIENGYPCFFTTDNLEQNIHTEFLSFGDQEHEKS